MANLHLEHHALRTQQSSVGLGNGDKEDGKNCREVCNITYEGARETSKDAVTINGRNPARCCKRFVEEGLSLCGYLLCVEIAAKEAWFVGNAIAVNRGSH